jgi:hypothetical protein
MVSVTKVYFIPSTCTHLQSYYYLLHVYFNLIVEFTTIKYLYCNWLRRWFHLFVCTCRKYSSQLSNMAYSFVSFFSFFCLTVNLLFTSFATCRIEEYEDVYCCAILKDEVFTNPRLEAYRNTIYLWQLSYDENIFRIVAVQLKENPKVTPVSTYTHNFSSDELKGPNSISMWREYWH